MIQSRERRRNVHGEVSILRAVKQRGDQVVPEPAMAIFKPTCIPRPGSAHTISGGHAPKHRYCSNGQRKCTVTAVGMLLALPRKEKCPPERCIRKLNNWCAGVSDGRWTSAASDHGKWAAGPCGTWRQGESSGVPPAGAKCCAQSPLSETAGGPEAQPDQIDERACSCHLSAWS